MTMMIKASEAECRNGIAQAELRYQALAMAQAAPRPVATIHQLGVNLRRQQACCYNPTGRVKRAASAR